MVLQLIYLLGLLLLAVMALRVVMRDRRSVPEPISYEDFEGSFDNYVERIDSLFRNSVKGFIVVAKAVGQPHFVQVNVGGVVGQRSYQFTLPIRDWSRPYIEKIEAETARLGNPASHHPEGPEEFLVVEFPDGTSHADFARWVVFDVYGLPGNTRFAISGS